MTGFDYETMQVEEGTTRLIVPASTHVKGPKAKEGVPFYNPAMRTARDVSVLILSQLVKADPRQWRIIDAMAATGARGLRLANEVPGVKVQLNDANPASMALAQHNVKQLGLRNVDFRVGRLESHLGAESYDWVDIDPFGTPAGFIDVAMLSVHDGGIVAVSATDRATLSGVYPEACLRRYNAKPLRGACMPELAARILAGAVVRAAGRRDRGARPLVAYATEHYARVYVQVDGGPQKADLAADQIGYARFHPDGSRDVGADLPPESKWAGPLWIGPIFDAELVKSMADAAATATNIAPATTKLLARWNEEASAPPLYYDIEELTRAHQLNAPRLDRYIEILTKDGIPATRTHFSPRGIKTTASPQRLRSALTPVKRAAA